MYSKPKHKEEKYIFEILQEITATKEALAVIKSDRGLIKKIRETSASVEDDQGWGFLLAQLANPEENRPSRYAFSRNPSNHWHAKDFLKKSYPGKVVKRKPHAMLTKKTATTLLPSNGRIGQFCSGVGLLFDLAVLLQQYQLSNKNHNKFVFPGNAFTSSVNYHGNSRTQHGITLQSLIDKNKYDVMNQIVDQHNELLMCLSKEALIAVFVDREDERTIRWALQVRQLLFQYIKINGENVFLPILVISPNFPPHELIITKPDNYPPLFNEKIIEHLSQEQMMKIIEYGDTKLNTRLFNFLLMDYEKYVCSVLYIIMSSPNETFHTKICHVWACVQAFAEGLVSKRFVERVSELFSENRNILRKNMIDLCCDFMFSFPKTYQNKTLLLYYSFLKNPVLPEKGARQGFFQYFYNLLFGRRQNFSNDFSPYDSSRVWHLYFEMSLAQGNEELIQHIMQDWSVLGPFQTDDYKDVVIRAAKNTHWACVHIFLNQVKMISPAFSMALISVAANQNNPDLFFALAEQYFPTKQIIVIHQMFPDGYTHRSLHLLKHYFLKIKAAFPEDFLEDQILHCVENLSTFNRTFLFDCIHEYINRLVLVKPLSLVWFINKLYASDNVGCKMLSRPMERTSYLTFRTWRGKPASHEWLKLVQKCQELILKWCSSNPQWNPRSREESDNLSQFMRENKRHFGFFKLFQASSKLNEIDGELLQPLDLK